MKKIPWGILFSNAHQNFEAVKNICLVSWHQLDLNWSPTLILMWLQKVKLSTVVKSRYILLSCSLKRKKWK